MGFLDAILHAAAISAIEARREVRQEEQQTRAAFRHCLDIEDSLNDLFRRTGSSAFYALSTRNYELEVSKMKDWMQSYKEYLSLGGDASFIKDVEDIDIELRFIKILSSKGKASEQNKYRNVLDESGLSTSTINHPALTSSRKSQIDLFNYHGLSKEDAAWFIDQYNVDWNKHAITDAQVQIRFGQAKTKEDLIRILTWDGFTESQIQNAVDYCWKD